VFGVSLTRKAIAPLSPGANGSQIATSSAATA